MTHSNSTQYVNPRVLKLNVGFIVAEGPGFSRVTDLDIPERLRVADDLDVEQLQGTLRLTRTSEGILLQGVMNCTHFAECNRCLEEVEITFDFDLEELFAIPLHGEDSAFVVGEDGILDLAPLLREEIFLQTPNHILCKADCKGLCIKCGQNLNHGECGCDREEIDPRWASLATLQKRLTDNERN